MQSGNRSGSQRSQEKVLCFKSTPISHSQEISSLITPTQLVNPLRTQTPRNRKVSFMLYQQFPTEPSVSLDAPDVEDNFYTTPIDWSINNYIALAA